jgi:hypothetical protein
MDYDSLSEEELQGRLANAPDLAERLKLRAALKKHQARTVEKRKWTRSEKIAAAAVLATVLIAAVGGAYKLLHPDKPNPSPAHQTDTPTIPPTDSQTPPKPKDNPSGPTVAPIPNPKMPAVQKAPDNFVSVPLSSGLSGDIKATLLGSTWVGQFPFAKGVVVRVDFEPDGTVNIKCSEDSSLCTASSLPTGTWTLHGNNLEIVFSNVTNVTKGIEANQQPVDANQHQHAVKVTATATGTVADTSIQGRIKTDDWTSNWILLPTKRQPQ